MATASEFFFSPGYLVAFLVFAGLAFARAWNFKQRTGRNPWGIHPIIWLVIGLVLGIIGSLTCLIAVYTTNSGSISSRRQTTWTDPNLAALSGSSLPLVPPPPSSPPGWHPDPYGRHHYRFWSGSAWSHHVATNGVVSSDPLMSQPSAGVTAIGGSFPLTPPNVGGTATARETTSEHADAGDTPSSAPETGERPLPPFRR